MTINTYEMTREELHEINKQRLVRFDNHRQQIEDNKRLKRLETQRAGPSHYAELKSIPKATSGVYKLLNTSNGLFYIGSSCDMRRRLYNHLYKLKKGYHVNPALQLAWKGSPKTWLAEVIEITDRNTYIEREQHWLDALEPWAFEDRGYNYRTVAAKRNNAKESFTIKQDVSYFTNIALLDIKRLRKQRYTAAGLLKAKKKIKKLEERIKMYDVHIA